MVAPPVDVKLPGRLGDPTRELRSDPRADPRVVAALAPLGLDVTAPPLPVGRDDPLDALLPVAAAPEHTYQTIFESLLADFPAADGVDSRTETVTGVDGN